MSMKKLFTFSILSLLLLFTQQAKAILTIEISDGYDNAIPIAVVPFATNDAAIPQDLAQIVGADLQRSGRFKPTDRAVMPQQPSKPADVNFDAWKPLGVDNIVIGTIDKQPNGQYQIDMRFMDVLRKTQVIGKRWNNISERNLRRIAHMISDLVYEELTGIRGAFNTQIAYVTMQRQTNKRIYTLEVADADGYNPQSMLRSPQPIMSPSWSPDGKQLAYVSFENRKPQIFVQSLNGKVRKKVAGFRGINSAPAWSPDGTQLAMTLSKGGNADVYIMDVASGKLTQITKNWAIETEAAWAPDGKSLYFNSDRRGQPQIFKYDLETGEETRITFEGKYNSNPEISPNGRYMAVVRGGDGFHIAVTDFEENTTSVITDTFLDESPSFSPNGEMVLYAMNKDKKGQLAVVALDGNASQILRVQDAEVREPAWGPFLTE